MMFTAPYIMAAPAMVNTSEFNLTMTHVQILKSQMPPGNIPENSEILDIKNDHVSSLSINHIIRFFFFFFFFVAVREKN